jgi:hypothetical protein
MSLTLIQVCSHAFTSFDFAFTSTASGDLPTAREFSVAGFQFSAPGTDICAPPGGIGTLKNG